jgi:diguanylate cyclase
LKYPHSRTESIEVFKKAVPLMSRHPAAFNPLSYAIWYEHAAGTNAALSQALAATEADPARSQLTDQDIEALYDTFVREHQARRVADSLALLVQEIAQIARDAGADLQGFRASLETRTRQLSEPLEQIAIQAVVAGLIGDTQQIRTVTGSFSESLAANLTEVAALQKSLKESQSREVEAQTRALEAQTREREEIAKRQEAEAAARVDHLTGLANLRGFHESIAGLSKDAALRGHALLFLDIDHFKATNDTYGHAFGNAILQAVARVLLANVKGKDLTARFGGEEFVVLLPETDLAGARVVAEQIRRAVAQLRIRKGSEIIDKISVSIGACIARDGESIDVLLERADATMYLAKQAGRNRVMVAEG